MFQGQTFGVKNWINRYRPGAQNMISMELLQKVWPIHNVKWVHAITYLDCLHVTAPGITQVSHERGIFSSLVLVLGKTWGYK